MVHESLEKVFEVYGENLSKMRILTERSYALQEEIKDPKKQGNILELSKLFIKNLEETIRLLEEGYKKVGIPPEPVFIYLKKIHLEDTRRFKVIIETFKDYPQLNGGLTN